MINVKATREGLQGGTTASGYIIDPIVPFVALPSTKALHRFVRVTNLSNGQSTLAVVLDVGPWDVGDHDYVFQPATMNTHQEGVVYTPVRPQAESGTDRSGRPTNGAGIDLSEAVWRALGLPEGGGSAPVSWEFA